MKAIDHMEVCYRSKVVESFKAMGYFVWLWLFLKFHEPDMDKVLSDFVNSFLVSIFMLSPIVAYSCNKKAFFWFVVAFLLITLAKGSVIYSFCLLVACWALPFLEAKNKRERLIGLHFILCFVFSLYVDILSETILADKNAIVLQSANAVLFLDCMGVCLFIWTLWHRFNQNFKYN